MIVYSMMLIISIFFATIVFRSKNKKNKIIFGILCAIPFIFVSAIRYDVGSDFIGRYTVAFLHIARGGIVSDYELGFHLLNKFCLMISKDPQVLFIVTSIIIYSLIFYNIVKYSKNPVISIIVFFFGAFYFQSLNGIRQYLAMALLVTAFPMVEDKKYIKLFLISLLAFNIHNISILLSLVYLYFIIFKKSFINNKAPYANIITLIIIIASVFLLKKILYSQLLAVMAKTRFSSYIGGMYDHPDFQLIPFIVNFFVYIYLIIPFTYRKKMNLINNNEKKLLFLQWIGVVLLFCTTINTLFLRISYMFTIFQIFSIPLYYEEYYKKNKNGFAYTFLLMIIMISSFMWINVYNQVEEALPYQTYFNKNK